MKNFLVLAICFLAFSPLSHGTEKWLVADDSLSAVDDSLTDADNEPDSSSSATLLPDSLLLPNPAYATFKFRHAPNHAFETGEVLKYRIKYGPVTAVNTEISVANDTVVRGHDCYQITYKASTLPFFDTFFKVRDLYQSFIDKKGIYPVRYTRQVEEGNYKSSNELEFFHERGQVWSRKRNKLFNIEPYTHDILSAYFYFRTLNLQKLKKGDVVTIKNFSDQKSYKLDIKIHRRDIIETELGIFRTIVVEPLVQGAGLFKSEGKIIIWMTDDENKIPLRISINVLVGSLYAEIIEISGLKNKKTAKLDW
ncbi:hypothetical protein Ctha_2483 [Chloroherpeton thalassium ATCC 35110]|uniref:DUF3108 domain-containing protein n=1 Tax=Chloroherpeton thalassium (strain ATCC 35110 / GB-78) TaxID=517418 RepID=B3QXL7_CHLT3|nr:DUF3108 domain-containing protein [Chloroherpeton thalassium]ACF14932.1 hypothetical protein Ctha_2483 [Chloroherpeton thalassium ATCC 35110]